MHREIKKSPLFFPQRLLNTLNGKNLVIIALNSNICEKKRKERKKNASSQHQKNEYRIQAERIHFCTFSPPSSSFYCSACIWLDFFFFSYSWFAQKSFQFCFLITISVNAIMNAYRHNPSNNCDQYWVFAICSIHTKLLTNKRSRCASN